jgi:HD superfamily phosphohydrolase
MALHRRAESARDEIFKGKEMDNDFNEHLAEIYKKKDWDNHKEIETAQKIIAKIEGSLRDRYTLMRPVNIGGAGILIKVKDINLSVDRVLKLSRPILGKEGYLDNILSSEITRLSEVTHQNIISIFYTDKVNFNNQDYHYYIMEYIENAVDGSDFITQNKPGFKDLVTFLIQWVSGLLTLHESGIIHGDAKLENILVSQEPFVAKVSDLGSARLLAADDNGVTNMSFTRGFAHPDLQKLLSDACSDPNRATLKINRSELKTAFDLYSLGKNIFRILRINEYKDGVLISEYQRNYLTLLAARLLDGENNTDETYLTIPYRGMRQIKYKNMKEVLFDLKKANGEYEIDENIPELNIYSNKTIQVSSSDLNTFTDRLSRLLDTKILSRLVNISQLGLMSFVYPTASHSRYEHVLGTMLNAARYANALWHDPVNPFFKQLVTEKDINSLLIAALLHDIGQYALAHDFEEADKQLFSHVNNNKRLLADSGIHSILEPILRTDWGIEIKDVYPILGIEEAADDNSYKHRLLRSILDGPIDADKLDYLIRDSNNLNIPYGKSIDLQKIIRSLTVVFERDPTQLSALLGIHEKAKIAAEGVAFARYALFGTVYWHHTIRSMKAMLHRAIWESLPVNNTDRRSKEYKQIQEKIFDEINQQLLSKKEPWLIDLDNEKLMFSGNMNLYDFKMLSFFYEQTNETGKELLKMICSRKIYKRLFIISSVKSPEIWEGIYSLRKDENWLLWLNFQKYFEDSMLEKIREMEPSMRTITALGIENTDRIDVLISKKTPIFLIDIPISRPGSSYPLRYLHEVRFANSIQYSPDEMIQPEDSIVWKSITEDLSKSIGKARVFCHPDVINTASVFYKKDMIEGAIYSALRKTKEG